MTVGTDVGFRSRRPEEEELARLRAHLAELQEELADRELDLATRRRELLDFQTRYLAIVGTRLAELDQLEAQIAALLAAQAPSPEADREVEATREAVIAKTDSRSLLGTLNDFSFLLIWQLQDEPAADLVEAAIKLSRTPVRALGPAGSPDGVTRDLLA